MTKKEFNKFLKAGLDPNDFKNQGYGRPRDWVHCKFCMKQERPRKAHLHQGAWVCENCWDERLRITE